MTSVLLDTEAATTLGPQKCPKNIEGRLALRVVCIKTRLTHARTERLERVYLQRFFCIDRQRESNIEETFKVLGSTGNVRAAGAHK